MKVCTFTILTQDEEIFAKFDEWSRRTPNILRVRGSQGMAVCVPLPLSA